MIIETIITLTTKIDAMQNHTNSVCEQCSMLAKHAEEDKVGRPAHAIHCLIMHSMYCAALYIRRKVKNLIFNYCDFLGQLFRLPSQSNCEPAPQAPTAIWSPSHLNKTLVS